MSNLVTNATLNLELLKGFKDFIENMEMEFVHRNREHVSLDDLFVFPDLKILNESLNENRPHISGENLWECGDRILILGDEQSGKTTLAKKLFLDALSRGFLPLLINGSKLKYSDIEDQIPKIVSEIYISLSAKELLQNPNLICIVDDMSACKLSKKFTSSLIERLNTIFPRTILLAEESYRFVAPDFPELDEYKKLEILALGYVRRSELIRKWVELGLTEEVDDQLILSKIDDLSLHVGSLVRKNIVPPKPIYILMLLQSVETAIPQKFDLTSHGHCYQHLIYQALERVHVKQSDVDAYLNILAELGGAILDSSSECLDSSNLNEFFQDYSKKFLPIDQNKVIQDLIRSSILVESDNGLKFRYRYLFYFFAAKKLADSLHRGDAAKQKIQNLVNTIHLEKASNIVLFLTHHSKDPWILDQILYSVMEIFSTEKEATLEAGSLSFLHDFIKEIPELVLENRKAQQERLKLDQQKDIVEYHEEKDNDENLEADPAEFMAKVNKVFRATEVCGQILRNRLGSLERGSLELIVEETLSVSLRFLNIFLKWADLVKEESVREIRKMLDQNPNLSNTKIEDKAESFYLALNYAFIFVMLQKVAFSLGSARGREIYIKVAQDKNTPASSLIQEIIELQFEKKIDFSKIEKLRIEFSKNPVCDRLLKHIIIRHCYMHDIGYQDRQRIANKLNISMNSQRVITLASQKTR